MRAGRFPAWGLGACAGSLFAAESLWMLARFGITYFADSQSYVDGGSILLDKSQSIQLFRQAPYLLMNWVTASSIDPRGLIFLQIGMASVAVALLVCTIAITNKTLAGLVGLFLLFDLTWCASNLAILLEGPLATLSVLALVLLLYHHRQQFCVGTLGLFLSGLFYGWFVMFRPNYVLLAPLFVIVYAFGTRSWLRTAAVTGGIGTVLLTTVAFNYWRTGQAVLLRAPGLYTQFYLFQYGMMTPSNGPASAALDTKLRQCFGDKTLEATTAYDNVHVVAVCLAGLPVGPDYWESALPYRTLQKAYPGSSRPGDLPLEVWDGAQLAFREAVISHPITYARLAGTATLEYLSIPVYRLVRDLWLVDSPRLYPHYPPGFWERVCPWRWCLSDRLFPERDADHDPWIHAVLQISRSTSAAHQLLTAQVHQLAAMAPGERVRPTQQFIRARREYLHSMRGLWIDAVGFATIALATLIYGRGAIRILGLTSLVFMLHGFVTAAAFNNVDARYVSQLSPFYCIVTAILVYCVLNLPIRTWAAMRFRRSSRPAQRSVVPSNDRGSFSAVDTPHFISTRAYRVGHPESRLRRR